MGVTGERGRILAPCLVALGESESYERNSSFTIAGQAHNRRMVRFFQKPSIKRSGLLTSGRRVSELPQEFRRNSSGRFRKVQIKDLC
jgi:hypothetical protein